MNFLCISNYNNNLDWISTYPNPHLIYDKTWAGGIIDNDNSKILPPSNLKDRYPNYNITNGSPNGYNISDYMTFIIDHYDNLPEVTVFLKGNTIGRHVKKEMMDKIINLRCFSPIEDWKIHDTSQLALQNGYAMISGDGGWMETNDSWYLKHPKHPVKYFTDYNDFIRFCFVDAPFPKYVRFPPGGNFVVPKEYVLKYDKIFYKNLRTMVNHTRVPGEGQMIERALYTIWMGNFTVAETMKTLIK